MRELSNVIERAVYRHEDPERAIEEINFDPFHSPWAPTGPATAPTAHLSSRVRATRPPRHPLRRHRRRATNDFRAAVTDYERQLLEEALSRNRFNQRATAAALNLSYDQLRHALKRHKLQDSAA